MSRIPVQEPTITEETGPTGGLKIEHPAFAQIAASRVSGRASLYGSDFNHHHYITITIAPSTLHRDLSRDWAHASLDAYIEVSLSEAQWASFVSSMNCGSGTQCTLTRHQGRMIPRLPDPISRKEQFKHEAKEAASEALAAIKELREAINDTSLSKKAKDELTRKANSVEARLTGSLPFVLSQFGEHMEQTVEKAKVEINAYATNAVIRAGINALGHDTAAPILSLITDTTAGDNQ